MARTKATKTTTKAKASKAAATGAVTCPGAGRKAEEGEKTVFLKHSSDPFEVQLGGNTFTVPGPGKIEVKSDNPHYTPTLVAWHIATQLSKRGGYTVTEE